MRYFILFYVFAIFLFSSAIEARFFLNIDSFIQGGGPLTNFVANDYPDDYWFTPFDYQNGRAPSTIYHTTTSAVGGQRDFVLGNEGFTPEGAFAALTISQRRCSIAFGENYVGGAYVQWDGDDFLGANPATNPTPGAFLNENPGMGAFQNVTPYPERNSDLRSVDFTSGGRATGIFIDITTDHEDTFYYMDVIDTSGRFNTIAWTVDPRIVGSQVLPTQFFWRYSNANWDFSTSEFDWSKVVAFQVRLWTFDGTASSSSQAIDSSFAFLFTFGYVIAGTVEIDCECSSTFNIVDPVEAERVDLRLGSTVIDFTFTDATGYFEFTGDFIEATTYQVCLNDLSTPRCAPANGCSTVTLSNLMDPPLLRFYLTAASTLIPPPDVTIPCDSCSTVDCLGPATRVDCAGGSTPVTNHVDSNPIGCDPVIIRTFNDNGVTVQQRITLVDDFPPVINPQATSSSAGCDLKSGTDQSAFTAWLNNRGGARATDACSDVIWSNNYVAPFPSGCDTTRTVTFTARDICSNEVSTTAAFRIFDDRDPVITREATSSSSSCTSSGSTSSFDTWLNTRGGATATDNCIANDNNLNWSSNFTGSIDGGCQSETFVAFTVTDPCGRTDTTIASFAITDTTGPTLQTPASSLSVDCNSDINTSYNNWIANHGGAVAVDACTSVVWDRTVVPPVPTSGCNSRTTVTFVASDICNNIGISTTATFTVTDTVPAFWTINPQNSGAECNTDIEVRFDDWIDNNAGGLGSDVCSEPVIYTNDFIGTGPSRGCNSVTPVRFFVADQCGNRSPAFTASFTVTDLTPPRIETPASDRLNECGPNTNQNYLDWRNVRGGAIATDECSSITWSNNGPASVSRTCNSVTTVLFTVTDSCGNQASTSASFIVEDTLPPAITPAIDRNVECSVNTQNEVQAWLNANGGAGATDQCGSVSWSNDYTGLDTLDFCTQFATVTFTVTDGCNHFVRTTATFTVDDNTRPIFTIPPQNEQTECDPTSNENSFLGWVNDHGRARATDNCVASENLIWSVDGFLSPIGCDTARVTFTVSDGCGNSISGTASYTIFDSIDPSWDPAPQSVSVECDGVGNVDSYVDWVSSRAGAVARDVCALSLTYTSTAPSVGPVGCGSVSATVTVADECGNSIFATATYTVVDTLPPSLTQPALDSLVQCASESTNAQQLQNFLTSHGGAQAVDICYSASSLSWNNNFVSLTTINCAPTATVTFTVTDPCGQESRTTALFSIIDTIAPIITTPARSDVYECNLQTNGAVVSTYINDRGGATATDSCSAVTWTNNFVNPPVECGPPLNIVFTARDVCGNSAPTTGSVQIIDTTPPLFVNFPPDTVIGCDQEPDPSITGFPQWSDSCSTDIQPSWTTTFFREPYDGLCPGDIIHTRVWVLVDDCGNTNTREQIIVQEIARSTGPCLPEDCPPCELVECCSEPLEDMECNPVPCLSVPCGDVSCVPVPCIPQNCGNPSPTGRPEGPVPLPSTIPAPSCEAVYIYIFDDDGVGDDVDYVPVYNPYVSEDSAETLQVSLFAFLLVILVLF